MNRICFVCLNAYKAFNPKSSANIGGTELQIATLATEFAKLDSLDIHCIVGDFGQAKLEQYDSISVHRSFSLSKSLANLVRAPFLLWRTLYSINPEIIISSPAGPEVGLLALYARLMRIRYIFRTASDVDCTKKKEKDMGILSGFLYGIGIRIANTIITQHDGQQKDLQKYYNRGSVIIKNGYDALRPSPQPSPRIGRGERTILWIGSSRRVKRPDLFFELAKALPHYEFTMILSHSGDEALFTWCKEKSQSISNVSFLGELQFHTVREQISQAKLLIGTSDYEGFPNTYVLAALAGVPVVSLSVNPDQYLTQYSAGVCANGDISAMQSAIVACMDDHAYYTKLSAAALRYAQEQYDITSIIPRWISVIHTTDYSL